MKHRIAVLAFSLTFAASGAAMAEGPGSGGPGGGMHGGMHGGEMGEHHEGPCKDKREAKHQSHEALHECLKAWALDFHPDAPDPSDDCSSKLSTFISASKTFKACVAQAKQQWEQKKGHGEGGTPGRNPPPSH